MYYRYLYSEKTLYGRYEYQNRVLTYLSWSLSRTSSGTAGSFLKSYEEINEKKYFYQVFLLDYIICNRDRHGANIEVLQKEENYRLAPLFDHGLSFMFSCYNDGEKMLEFDKLKDGPVNNYVGSMNLSDNLKLVPKTFRQKVTMPSRAQLFQGLENAKGAVPEEYWDCIYDMVKERINYVKNI